MLHMRAVAVDAEAQVFREAGRRPRLRLIVVVVGVVVVVIHPVVIQGVVTKIGIDRIFALVTCHRPNDRAKPSFRRVARATSGDSTG